MLYKKQSSKFKWFLLISLAIFFLHFFLPREFFLPFRFLFQATLAPFEEMFSSVGSFLRDEGVFFTSLRDLKRENQELFEENIRLQVDAATVRELQEENSTLRKMTEVSDRKGFDRKGGVVIVKDSTERGKWIFIDRGSIDSVKKGFAVLGPGDVLIGFVDEAYLSSSRVKLLTHPESAIPGRVAGSGAKGVIRGEHGLGILLDMVSQTGELSKGAFVVTDNIADNIPGGLLVGTVQEPEFSSDRLFLQSVLLPPLEYESLRFVSVLIPTASQ